ncbi:MAG: NAD-dependent epimerase/dehydratase family protein [Polyangiaceae bacterium]|nr:NAD-dependent epimerase/dehydratase family protein [Polyangiaceae bacterium]
MTVLVTGATGFLGSHIAEILANSGKQVRALVRRSSDTSFLEKLPNVELCFGAVEDRESLQRAAAGVEYLIHSAGVVKASSKREFFRINEGGTENAVAAALHAGPQFKRFVLVSSLAALGPSDAQGNAVPSERSPMPCTTYGESKLAAERAVLKYQDRLSSVMVRPPTIYGPRDREVLIFFKTVKNGVLPLTSPLDAKFSMIYGPDAADACVRGMSAAVRSGSGYFVDDGKVYSFRDMIELTEAAVGKKAWLRLPIPKRVVRTLALGSELYGKATKQAVMFTREKCNDLFSQWVCDSTETRKDLGWEPKVPFAEGIMLTADWYRKAGWL